MTCPQHSLPVRLSLLVLLLLATHGHAQFQPGDFQGVRWDPMLRCWVAWDGNTLKPVPWNQRLLRKSDATGSGVVKSKGGIPEAGPPFANLNTPVSTSNTAPPDYAGIGDAARRQIVFNAVNDAKAARDGSRLAGGDAGLLSMQLDVNLQKARNAGYYSDTASLLPADETPNVPGGATFSVRALSLLSQPGFPDGLFKADDPPPPNLPPPPPRWLIIKYPPPQFTDEERKKIQEAAQALAKKQAEANATGQLQVIDPAIEGPLGRLEEMLERFRAERGENSPVVRVLENHIASERARLGRVTSQLSGDGEPPVRAGEGWLSAPIALGDGTQHYPYIPELPITDNFLRPDGGLITHYGDGTREYTAADGTRVVKYKDGRKRITQTDGTVIWLNPDGSPYVGELENAVIKWRKLKAAEASASPIDPVISQSPEMGTITLPGSGIMFKMGGRFTTTP